jgi:hypothetical protein
MKKFMSFVTILLLGTGLLLAQAEQSGVEELSKQELRKQKKEQKLKEQKENLTFYDKIAAERSWVIEAHTIYNKYGDSFQMDPTINFVSLNGDESIVQLGFNGYIGYNGVGGVTFEGKVQNYEVNREENSILIRFTSMGAVMGPVDIVARISSDGYGRITVSGNWGRRLTFAGYFVPYDTSRTYTGTPFF